MAGDPEARPPGTPPGAPGPSPGEDRLFWLLLVFPVLAIFMPLLIRKACGT